MAELFETMDGLKLSKAHDDLKMAEFVQKYGRLRDFKVYCYSTKMAELFEIMDDLKV